jgi:uncharacterized protein YjlB
MSTEESNIIVRLFEDDGRFPNNGSLPLIIITAALDPGTISPEKFERTFTQNGWPAAWRNGLFDFHHYHSSAHEVLGVYSGWVKACFGGPQGETLKARAGDIIVIPAGVSHCNVGQSSDFRVVGAYPTGQEYDMMYGNDDDRPQADENIKTVGRPLADPVFGPTGPLIRLWS